MKSLAKFHFDPKKSGTILKNWVKESGFSYHQIADMTGIPYDTLNNSIQGRVLELSIERAFKVAVCTGHSTCEYIKCMLQDEDIDFRHRVHVLRDVPMERALFVDHPDDCCASIPNDNAIFPAPPPQEIPAIPAVVSNGVHDRYTKHLVEQYKDQIQQLIEQNKSTIAYYKEREQMLIREHDQHVTDIKGSHIEALDHLKQEREREIGYLKAENVRQRKWIVRLGVMLGIETAAVVGVFMYDALHQNVGWFRGFLNHFSNAPFDTLKS